MTPRIKHEVIFLKFVKQFVQFMANFFATNEHEF